MGRIHWQILRDWSVSNWHLAKAAATRAVNVPPIPRFEWVHKPGYIVAMPEAIAGRLRSIRATQIRHQKCPRYPRDVAAPGRAHVGRCLTLLRLRRVLARPLVLEQRVEHMSAPVLCHAQWLELQMVCKQLIVSSVYFSLHDC